MRIAHLSDPHLMRGPLAAMPAANLADALGRALSIQPRPDCVVVTGDLADTGHPEEYTALRDILRRCPIPVHLAAGNHDDPAAVIARFGDTPFLGNGVSPSYVVEYPQATIVIANSWMLGSPAGYLGREQLAWIGGTLAARPDVPAFVCLHHPPLPVGIPFLDGMMLTDAAGLADVIRRHPHVTRVLAVAPAPRWRCPGLSDPHPPLCAQSRRIAVGYKELPAVARKTPARKTPARQAPMVRPERPSSAALARGALDAEVRKERTPRWAQPGELDYGAHWHRCPRLLPWRAPR